jgi:hypothetical protein
MNQISMNSLPIEIFEMIIGNVQFMDLFHFLEASQFIQVSSVGQSADKSAFEATRYHPQYELITKHEPETFSNIHFYLRTNPQIRATVHEVFRAFMEVFCEVTHAKLGLT